MYIFKGVVEIFRRDWSSDRSRTTKSQSNEKIHTQKQVRRQDFYVKIQFGQKSREGGEEFTIFERLQWTQ